MKIISNFKDYYDSMLQYGKDESLVFTRINSQPIKFDSPSWQFDGLDNQLTNKNLAEKIEDQAHSIAAYDPMFDPIRGQFGNLKNTSTIPPAKLKSITTVVNGKAFKSFCILEEDNLSSNVYKIVKRNVTPEEAFNYLAEHLDFFSSWSLKSFTKFKNYEQFKEESLAKKNPYFYFKYHRNINKNSPITENQLIQIHQEVDSPIYYIISGKVQVNIPLTYFGLTNLFDNVEVLHQEIAYCLGNVIQNKNEPPAQISNNMKIQQHGFDNKVSFRKRK